MAEGTTPVEISDETQVHLPETWLEAADVIAYDSITTPPPICVVCGPGKSTFSRHLLNVFIHRYRRVGYLDTDLDQAEFTPPGCLSLTIINEETPDLAIPCLRTPERFGFSSVINEDRGWIEIKIFSKPQRWKISFFYGDISPRRDPEIYLTYILELYDYYYKNYQQSDDESHFKIGVPLVVNAPHWLEDTGYDILINMLKYMTPSHVVKISGSVDESKNLPLGNFWLEEGVAQDVTIVEIDSDCQDSFRKTVHTENNEGVVRDVGWLAYFRKCFPININMNLMTIKELHHQLAAYPPYEIPMSTLTIVQLHNQVSSTEIIKGFVGLASSTLVDSKRLPFCVGLGIVREVDTSRKIMYLITPIPKSILKNVDHLLFGLIKIPASLLQVQRHMTSNTRSTDSTISHTTSS